MITITIEADNREDMIIKLYALIAQTEHSLNPCPSCHGNGYLNGDIGSDWPCTDKECKP